MPMKPKSITDLILETVHTQEIVTPKVESFMLDYDFVEGCQHIASSIMEHLENTVTWNLL